MSQKVIDALVARFGAAIEPASQHTDEVAYVPREKLIEIADYLKDDPAMAFDAPVFVTAIDLLDLRRPDEHGVLHEVDTQKVPRFEVCYQLRSTKFRYRIRLKIRVADGDCRLPSLATHWPAFNWQERETFDMYGIRFEGHPDLRRVYLYEEFVGYPLRKDYPKEKRQPLVRRSDLIGQEE